MNQIRWEGFKTISKDANDERTVTCGICGGICEKMVTFLYCYRCKNVGAINYFEELLQPGEVLHWNWRIDSSIDTMVNEILCFRRYNHKEAYVTVLLLQMQARQEDRYFKHYRSNEHLAGLIYSIDRKTCIGYLMWTEDENKPTLRQIYLLPDYRLSGYGAQIIKFWVEEIADKISSQFYAESPNRISKGILTKLGFLNEGNEKCIIFV